MYFRPRSAKVMTASTVQIHDGPRDSTIAPPIPSAINTTMYTGRLTLSVGTPRVYQGPQ